MKSQGSPWIVALAIAGTLLSTPLETRGSSKWKLEPVVSSSTAVGAAPLLNGFQAPATSGLNVAFVARDAAGAKGIYTNIGGPISKFVDTNPSTTDISDWTDLGDPSISGDTVAFWATWGAGHFGIYSNVSGSIKWIIQNDKYGGFSEVDHQPAISGQHVALMARAAQSQVMAIGLSVGGQTPTPVARIGGNTPGGGIFQNLGTPSVYFGNMAYWGSTNNSQGIYTNMRLVPETIADTSTAIPMGNGNFTGLSNPAIHAGGNVAFKGIGIGGQQGIYVREGGTWGRDNIIVIADTNTSAPDGTGHFAEFFSLSMYGSDVAFHARSERGEGIYVNIGGLSKVLCVNDVLDGKTVASVSMGREAVAGGEKTERIVFAVGFSDRSSAIYRAEFDGLTEEEVRPSGPCKIERVMDSRTGRPVWWKMEGDCSILRDFYPMGIIIPEKWNREMGMNPLQVNEKDLTQLLERMSRQEREEVVHRARSLSELADTVEKAARGK